MKNSETVKSNYIYHTLFQMLVLLIPLITTPYVARVLGVNGVGQYSYSYAMVTYFTIFATFGSSTYGQRAVAYNRDNKQECSDSFWSNFAFRVISSIFASVGYIVYLLCSEGFSLLNFIFILYIFDVVADISWLFQGLEKFKQIVLRNFIIKIISLILVFTLVKSPSDIWLYALILSGASVLGNLSMWIIAPHYISKPQNVSPFGNLKEMTSIFLPTIAIQVYAVLDKSMIGWITMSTFENGCYEQAEKIVRIALTVVTSIGTVVLPRVSNLFHKGEYETAKKYVYYSYRFTWFLAFPIMFGIIAISPILIPVYLGAGYEEAIDLLCLFSMLVVFVSLANTTGKAYLIPTQQQNIYTLSVSVAAVLNLCLNMWLIPVVGAKGAAIASVSAEGLGCCIQIVYCLARKQFSARKVFYSSWRYFLSGLVMLIILLLIRKLLVVSIISLFMVTVIGAFIYMGCLLVLRDDLMMNSLKKILK